MKQFQAFTPNSDQYDALVSGIVLANRIGDVVARPDSKRYKSYLKLLQDQFTGEPELDPADQYREKNKELLPRALDAYQKKYGRSTPILFNIIYFHDEFPIAAVPDGTEGVYAGLTIHIRKTEEGYKDAVKGGLTASKIRNAQAMMAITRHKQWYDGEYFERESDQMRRLFVHDRIDFDARHATELEQAMINFAAKARFKAAEEISDV